MSPTCTPSLLSINSGCSGEQGQGQREANELSGGIPLPTLNSIRGVYCTRYWVIFFNNKHSFFSKHISRQLCQKVPRSRAECPARIGGRTCLQVGPLLSDANALAGQTLLVWTGSGCISRYSFSEFASLLEITFPVR